MTVMCHTVHYCLTLVCTCASILRRLRLVSGLKDCSSVTVASGTEGGRRRKEGGGGRREEEEGGRRRKGEEGEGIKEEGREVCSNN